MDYPERIRHRRKQRLDKLTVTLTGLLGLLAAGANDGCGQDYQVLHRFESDDGRGPHAPLVIAGSKLYGTIGGGGGPDLGEVFTINTDGSRFAVLKRFTGSPNGL